MQRCSGLANYISDVQALVAVAGQQTWPWCCSNLTSCQFGMKSGFLMRCEEIRKAKMSVGNPCALDQTEYLLLVS